MNLPPKKNSYWLITSCFGLGFFPVAGCNRPSPKTDADPRSSVEAPSEVKVDNLNEASASELIVAMGNSGGILKRNFDERLHAKGATSRRELRPRSQPDGNRFEIQVLGQAVYHELLAQESARRGLNNLSSKVDEKIATLQTRVGNWNKYLQRKRETERSTRELILADLREEALLESSGASKVSEEQIKAMYERIKGHYRSDKQRISISEIFVSVDDKQYQGDDIWEHAKSEAEKIRSMALASPQDFAELARKHSHGLNAKQGGKVGVFSLETRPRHFRKQDFKLKAGSISEVVQAKAGYYIFMIEGQHPPGFLPREVLEEQLQDRLASKRLKEEKQRLRQSLIDRAKAIVRPGPALAATGIKIDDVLKYLETMPTQLQGRRHFDSI